MVEHSSGVDVYCVRAYVCEGGVMRGKVGGGGGEVEVERVEHLAAPLSKREPTKGVVGKQPKKQSRGRQGEIKEKSMMSKSMRIEYQMKVVA